MPTHIPIPLTQPFTNIPPKTLPWLWHPRIPLGKITLLAGDPGTGKTSLLLNLAALLSQGLPLPTPSSPCQPLTLPPPHPRATLLLNPDDNEQDTLRPKLDRLHANLHLIHTLPNFHSLLPFQSRNSAATFTENLPDPLATLDAALASIPHLALLIIDPITHYLGLTDHLLPAPSSPNQPPARTILHALSNLAQKHQIALILTTRLTKKTDPSLPPHTLQRTLGTLAFSTAARSILLLLPTADPVPDPDPDPSRNRNPNRNPPVPSPPSDLPPIDNPPPTHLLLTIKSNHAHLPPPLPLTLADPILFHPEQPLSPSHSSHKKTGPPDLALQSAAEFLRLALANGPVSADALAEDAKSNLIAPATLHRAKHLADAQSCKQEWSGRWFWQLVGETRPLPENKQERQFAQLLRSMSGGGHELDNLAEISRILDGELDNLAEKKRRPTEKPDNLAAKSPKSPKNTPADFT